MKQLGPRWPRKLKTRIRSRKRGPITISLVPIGNFHTATAGFCERIGLPEYPWLPWETEADKP